MQKNNIKYRTELKYICFETELKLIENRIRYLVSRDSHIKQSGAYTVRSVYFDDFYNSCYYQVQDGVDNRRKYRIRIYNCDRSYVMLEEKNKHWGKSYKDSCRLTIDQCEMLLNNKPVSLSHDCPSVLKRLCAAMHTQMMHPCIVVDYQRTPFIYHLGNIRVTFDRYISTSSHVERFFDRTLPLRPIMQNGQHILEVKFDEFLVDYVHHTLQLDYLQQTAFSKYYLCRKYAIGDRPL